MDFPLLFSMIRGISISFLTRDESEDKKTNAVCAPITSNHTLRHIKPRAHTHIWMRTDARFFGIFSVMHVIVADNLCHSRYAHTAQAQQTSKILFALFVYELDKIRSGKRSAARIHANIQRMNDEDIGNDRMPQKS